VRVGEELRFFRVYFWIILLLLLVGCEKHIQLPEFVLIPSRVLFLPAACLSPPPTHRDIEGRKIRVDVFG